MSEKPFGAWLRGELFARQMTVRELSRLVAAKHLERSITAGNPGAGFVSCETVRRAIYKYFDGTEPSPPMRSSIADALLEVTA